MLLYERMGFVNFRRLLNYYRIGGKEFDCYLYAKFVNGNGAGACGGDEGGGEGNGTNISQDFVGEELISNTTAKTIVTTALSSQWTAVGNARLAAGGWMYYRYYGHGIKDNGGDDECDGDDDENGDNDGDNDNGGVKRRHNDDDNYNNIENIDGWER